VHAKDADGKKPIDYVGFYCDATKALLLLAEQNLFRKAIGMPPIPLKCAEIETSDMSKSMQRMNGLVVQ